MTKSLRHVPVLLEEVICVLKDRLNTASHIKIVDATFGGGGYTKRFLSEFTSCEIMAIDRDPDAYFRAKTLSNDIQDIKRKVTPIHSRFGLMRDHVKPFVDAVVFDLGMS